MICQRCKRLWLREGDCNSKFFHAATKTRHKMNDITTMSNEDGELVGWDWGLEETMRSYFSNLFSATNTKLSEVVKCVSIRVNEEQNSLMLASAQSKEVRQHCFICTVINPLEQIA